MSEIDYYQILQVEPGATPGDIRQAYYDLAQKRFAQRGKDIETAVPILQVTEAYTVLANPYRRAVYDLERLQGSSPTGLNTAISHSTEHSTLTNSPASLHRIQWCLMAGILLLGAGVFLSARSLGLYWLPVLMIVTLCVAMNLLAIFLTRNFDPGDVPNEGDD